MWSPEVERKNWLSKNIYRAGELKVAHNDLLLGERPGITSLRSRFLRDLEDELTRVKSELAQLRETYEREAKSLTESYSRKKASLESDLAEIRNTSEQEAKRIRDGAAQEVEKEKKRGHDEGFAEGHAEGLEQSGKLIAGDLARMQQQILDARQAFLDRILASEPKIFETALGIAERIVRQKIQADPNVVREVVREAVAQIRENHPLRIRVHPADIARLDEFKKLSPDAFRDLQATFLSDETLQPGDCVVETGLEFIDATVSKKLETLRDRLIPRTVL